MRRSVYFIVEAVSAFIVSSILMYFPLKNMTFDFYHNSDQTLEGVILFVAFLLYAILTVCYIILGFKKVREWRWWMGIITVVISAAMGLAGMISVLYVSELIHSILN